MQADARTQPSSKRILIVEDNELNMKLLHDILHAYGYALVTTEFGATVLDLACQHRPDLILMDLQLPDVSGLDVVRRLKDHVQTRDIPVVAVTAFAMAGDEHKALTGGCDGYVSKPIVIKDFLKVVESFIGVAR